jgi:hypothetical protein
MAKRKKFYLAFVTGDLCTANVSEALKNETVKLYLKPGANPIKIYERNLQIS